MAKRLPASRVAKDDRGRGRRHRGPTGIRRISPVPRPTPALVPQNPGLTTETRRARRKQKKGRTENGAICTNPANAIRRAKFLPFCFLRAVSFSVVSNPRSQDKLYQFVILPNQGYDVFGPTLTTVSLLPKVTSVSARKLFAKDDSMRVFCLFICLLLAAGSILGAGCGKGDLSTPKGAAKTFATALENGDADAAKKACTGGDPKMIDSLANAAGNMKKMREAAISKFGDEGKTAFNGPDGDDMGMMTTKVDDAVEKIDGDKAMLTLKDGKPLALKKVDGDWKVDVSEMSGLGSSMGAAMFDSMGKAAKEVTDDVNTGKYKSAADAKTAFGQKMMGGVFGGGLPK
jgi:hypothetical protein